MQLRAVLYDWDGTLADSAEASFHCYQSMFTAYRIPFDREAYARTYSPDWHRTYAALRLPRERWEEADARFLEAYCTQTVPLVPGARELLDRLAGLGLAQGIVTSGTRSRVAREVDALGIAPFVAVLVCGDDITRRKPHPEALHRALDTLGLPPAEAVYVGDSPEDVEMARNGGVRSIGVPGGFPNRDALAAARPDALASSLWEAAELLARWRA